VDSQGRIVSVAVLNGGRGYSVANPPTIDVYPYGYGGKLVPVIETDGSISDIIVENSGSGYPYVDVVIAPPSPCQYPTRTNPFKIPEYLETSRNSKQTTPSETFPGIGPFTVFSENPYLPGPPLLPPPPTATPTVDEAIVDVTICNCECWSDFGSQ
jgi:hypothetical protein